MNFDTVELLGAASNEVVSMAFKEPSIKAPYTVKAILGLDVDEVITSYIGVGSGTTQIYNMTVGKREVVLNFAITPRYGIGESVSSLRDNIYRAISANRTGAMTLKFKLDDTVVAFIKGFTTKIEADQFSESPQIKLTLDCSRDPLLRSEAIIVQDTNEFSNNLAIINDPVSTAPHGIGMSFYCNEAVSSFTISDDLPQPWSFVVTPGIIGSDTGFKVGDSLHISSEDHNYQLYVVRNAVTTHLAQGLSLGSVWPYMYPGETSFRYSNEFNCSGLLYRQAFWGI